MSLKTDAIGLLATAENEIREAIESVLNCSIDATDRIYLPLLESKLNAVVRDIEMCRLVIRSLKDHGR